LGQPVHAEENYGRLESEFALHGKSWGGAFVDGDVLVVKTTLPVEVASRRLSQIGVSGAIEIRPTAVSMVQLQILQDELSAARIPGVIQFGPQYASGRLMIGVNQVSDSLKTFLASNDESLIGIYEAPTFQTMVDTRRFYPNSFFGGAAIKLASPYWTGNCSSAFSWTNANGYPIRMLTAGHCAPSGAGGSQPVNVQRMVSGSDPVKIGEVAWTTISPTGGTSQGMTGDIAGIVLSSGINASPKIWVGSGNTPNSMDVIGRRTLPENWGGTNVYTSGAGGIFGPSNYGQIQLTSVVGRNLVVYDGGDLSKAINGLTAMNGNGCTTDGDSGGAVYQASASGAWALGVISGGAFGGAFCWTYFTPVAVAVADWSGDVLKQ